jgi:hypothetical protein
MLPLYIVGGLLAVGMTLGDILPSIKRDISNAVGLSEKLKTILFQVLQALLFLSLAFALSWVAVGFISRYEQTD